MSYTLISANILCMTTLSFILSACPIAEKVRYWLKKREQTILENERSRVKKKVTVKLVFTRPQNNRRINRKIAVTSMRTAKKLSNIDDSY